MKKTLSLILCLANSVIVAQTVNHNFYTNGSSSNAINTAVPFLTISPDARSGSLGDAGVAISPDANATYWNPSKLAFLDTKSTVSLSYSPWLRNLLPNVNLAYVNYVQKIDSRNAFGISLRYFNLGTSDLYDDNQVSQGTYQPVEFSIDASIARKFGDDLSLGLTFRYIRSNLSNGTLTQGQQRVTGYAVSADVSLFSRHPTYIFGKESLFGYGLDISNIGSKMTYANIDQKYFLPINLRIGASNNWSLDDYNKLMITLDLNKLLVPTPPIRDDHGNIIAGKDDNRSVPAGIFGSFSDAPGGLSEELQEITYSGGIEYWYDQAFALRVGYFYQNPNKGDRQFLTLGSGFKFREFKIDFSYLIASQQNSPLANTLRFSLCYNFGDSKQ